LAHLAQCQSVFFKQFFKRETLGLAARFEDFLRALVREATICEQREIRRMAIPRNTEPALNSACQLRHCPELTVGRSGVRAEKLAWRVLMQFAADGLPLRWHELSTVAADTPID
jgi:hypothetical protein